jgi:hypothetical protein
MEKEIEEDDEEEEDDQLMKLFFTESDRRKEKRKRRTGPEACGAGQEHRLKELYTLCRRHGCRRIAHARKRTRTCEGGSHEGPPQKAASCAKLHRQLMVQRRRRRQAAEKKRISVSDIFEDAIAMKMFLSVFDPEDILEDWNWNLDEAAAGGREAVEADSLITPKETEDIFRTWRWNFEAEEAATAQPEEEVEGDSVKQCYYDIPGVNGAFNDFNFWRQEAELADLFPPAAAKEEEEEDACWSLWTEWGSVDQILANTLEAELPLEEEDEEVKNECRNPRIQRLRCRQPEEEFYLPMADSRCRRQEEEEDHWSLWTEWGSVDEILDNTLVAGLSEPTHQQDNDVVDDCKDEDVDSGFLGDTEEDVGKWSGEGGQQHNYWQNTYDNETILQSLVDDEMVEEKDGDDIRRTVTPVVAYWDESQRNNREILEALLNEELPMSGGGGGAEKKRKFEEYDNDITDDETENDDEAEPMVTISALKNQSPREDNGSHHQRWEAAAVSRQAIAKSNENNEDKKNDDLERELCSCESGVFWLSTEDNRRIAESLIAEQMAAAAGTATAFWEVSRENREIALALVGDDHGSRELIGGEEDEAETEDFFRDWRRNLASPKKSK